MTFYVAANGNDQWSGRLPWPNARGTDGPFATLHEARLRVRALDKTGLTQISVQFRGGTYYLPQMESFDNGDSGSAQLQVVYESFPGESAAFSGGVRVQSWANVGGNKWRVTLPAGTAYFENLFYNGERRLRPRLGGYLGAYFYIANPVTVHADDPTYSPTACPVQINDATNPNKAIYECFDRFQYSSGDPISANWANLTPTQGNFCGAMANPNQKAQPGDIELLDFEQFSTSKLRISCIDTANGIIYLTGQTTSSNVNYTENGFQQGRRYLIENVEDAFTEPGQWFLDDSNPRSMVLSYLANPGEDPNRDTVIIPQTTPPLMRTSNLQYVTFRGLTFEYDNYIIPPTGHPSRELEIDIAPVVSIQDSQNIIFDCSTVRQASGTGLEILSCLPADPTSRLPPPLNSPPAWCAEVTAKVVSSNNAVTNSSFYDIGALGMRIGDPWVPKEDDENIPQQITVENNVVEGYGRIIPASFGIGQGMGHNNLYTHNDVYDGYHCAISISQQSGQTAPAGSGNAYNTISFNHVYDLLQGIMSDGGSIRIDAGNAAYTAPGNVISNNKIHDVTDASSGYDENGYGGNGVYLDNSTGDVVVKNNLVYRVSDTAVYTPHGPGDPGNVPHPNIVTNNILAFARKAMIGVNDPYYDGEHVPNQVFQSSHNLMFFDRNPASSGQSFYVQGDCTYTNGKSFAGFQLFSSNLYWRLDGTFASDPDAFRQQIVAGPGAPSSPCANDVATHPGDYAFYSFAQWQIFLNEDAGSVIRNPHFVFPYFPFDDYHLLFGPPIAGFSVFDPDQAGRMYPSYFPPPVPRTFMTKPFNPWTDF